MLVFTCINGQYMCVVSKQMTPSGNQMISKSGMLPPRKSKMLNTNHQGYRGDESAKEVHMRDSPRCQSFSADVPLHMAGGGSSCDASGPFPSSSLDGCHVLTSTTKRGNQMISKSGMLPPRKSKKLNTNHQGYRGDGSAKKVQATQQLTTQEILKHDGLQKIPSSTRASTSLEAAVSQYGSDIQLEKTSVNKENALPKRAYDKLSCSSLPTQATESTTPKSLNSKLFSSITAIRNFKRRDFEGNKTFFKDYMGVPNSEPLLPFLMHKQINQGQIRHQHLSHPNSLNSSEDGFWDDSVRIIKDIEKNSANCQRHFSQQSHDFEPVTIPITMAVHSPSRVVVPPHMEEEALFDSVKDIMKDGPVPPGPYGSKSWMIGLDN